MAAAVAAAQPAAVASPGERPGCIACRGIPGAIEGGPMPGPVAMKPPPHGSCICGDGTGCVPCVPYRPNIGCMGIPKPCCSMPCGEPQGLPTTLPGTLPVTLASEAGNKGPTCVKDAWLCGEPSGAPTPGMGGTGMCRSASSGKYRAALCTGLPCKDPAAEDGAEGSAEAGIERLKELQRPSLIPLSLRSRYNPLPDAADGEPSADDSRPGLRGRGRRPAPLPMSPRPLGRSMPCCW
mmetsp:Transcript_54755/g.146577  ORF Transcript_54755/g.146577 Transcript_54755/m.146577 type:complete len:237 (+) Transcript_54755:294-1004(+)